MVVLIAAAYVGFVLVALCLCAMAKRGDAALREQIETEREYWRLPAPALRPSGAPLRRPGARFAAQRPAGAAAPAPPPSRRSRA